MFNPNIDSLPPPHFSAMEDSSSKKRKREEEEIQESSKKQCLEKENYLQISNEKGLPEDIFNKILSYLSYQDVLHLEQTDKNYQQWTTRRWEELKEDKFFNFNWSSYQEETKTHCTKYCYLLSRAIDLYVKCCLDLSTDKLEEAVSKLYLRFESFMHRFPSFFGAYIWYDLKQKVSSLPFSYQDIFQSNEKNLAKLPSREDSCGGGELLLQGLYHMNVYLNDRNNEHLFVSYQYFEKAIKKNATCASYLAYKVNILNKEDLRIDKDWFYSLGVLSASQNDFRGLDCLMWNNTNYAKQRYQKGIYYPSILSAVASVEEDLVKKEQLYTQALEAYGEGNVPAEVWFKIGFAEYQLRNWSKAAEYYEEAIKAYGEKDVSAPLWAYAAGAQSHLSNWPQAAKYYEKAIKAFGEEPVPAQVWANAARAQSRLSNWPQAAKYYEEAFKAFGEGHIPAQVWAYAATAEVKLDNWPKAAEYFEKAIKTCGEEHVPARVWANAATAQLSLRNTPKAAEYFEKAIKAYGEEHVPARVWANAATAQAKKLSNWPKAAEYFEKAIKAFEGRDIPDYVWAYAALTQLNLSNWPKAAEYYEEAIKAFEGRDIPAEIWLYMEWVKMKLNSLDNQKI